LQSCNESDNSVFYNTFGVLNASYFGATYILLDDGVKVFPINSLGSNIDDFDKERVMVVFTTDGIIHKDSTRVDATINDLRLVPTYVPEHFTADSLDLGVFKENGNVKNLAWYVNGFLTVQTNFSYRNIDKHTFGFMYEEGENPRNDTVFLRMFHNGRTDESYYTTAHWMSVRLNDLPYTTDSAVIAIKYAEGKEYGEGSTDKYIYTKYKSY